MHSSVLGLCLVLLGSVAFADQAARNTPFMQKHPHTSYWKSYQGLHFSSPLRIYDASMTLILGRADLNEVRKLAQGSSLQPVILEEHGVQYASARMYIVEYKDTEVGGLGGQYNEFIFAFDTNENETFVGYQSPLSLLDPASVPGYRLFLDKLIVDREFAIGVGVDMGGFDKTLGQVRVDTTMKNNLMTKTFSIQNKKSRHIVSGSVTIDKSTVTPMEIPLGQANIDIRDESTNLNSDVLSWCPSFGPFQNNGHIRISKRSKTRMAKTLRAVNFEPLLIINAEKAQFIIDKEK